MSNISNSQLCMSAQNAYNNNNLSSFVEKYREWQVSRCTHPKRINIADSHTGKMRMIEVPCGHCYHCRETHINEWVTRMYAHLQDFKNAYFVTLTYRPVSSNPTDIEMLYMHKFQDAIFHLDDLNATKSLSYNPCVLVKKHYQDFLKRLRKYTGLNDITYIVSGEYGKSYGRPHYHFILFTNGSLSLHDIRRAWSLALFRHSSKGWQYRTNQKKDGTPYNLLLGRVDFHNLVENGTINKGQTIKVDNNYLNAAHCFAYVCKYVCKQDSYNKFRIRLAYNNLYKSIRMVKFGQYEILLDGLEDFLSYKGFKFNNEQIKFLKSKSYEKYFNICTDIVCDSSFKREKVFETLHGTFVEEYYPRDYWSFVAKFTPFVEFSRGTPIGSLYAKNHIQEFAEGIFKRPLLQDKSFVVPRYFFAKASAYIYGLRQVRTSISSTSYSMGNLPNLYGFLSALGRGDSEFYRRVYNFDCFTDLQKVIKSELSFFDCYTKEHIIFPYNPVFKSIRVEYYKYDRSKRDYYLSRETDIVSFVDSWLERMENEQKRYAESSAISHKNFILKERAFDIAKELGFNLAANQKYCDEQNDRFLRHQQVLYDETHLSVE